MEKEKKNLNSVFDAKTIEELDSAFEVQMLIYGPKKHMAKITEYNCKVTENIMINRQTIEKYSELNELDNTLGIVRLFKGRAFRDNMHMLEMEIKKLEVLYKENDILIRKLLKEIREIEQDMFKAEDNIKNAGLSVGEFKEMYYKCKDKINEPVINKIIKKSTQPSQMGEE